MYVHYSMSDNFMVCCYRGIVRDVTACRFTQKLGWQVQLWTVIKACYRAGSVDCEGGMNN